MDFQEKLSTKYESGKILLIEKLILNVSPGFL